MIQTLGTKSFHIALALFVTLLAGYAFMQSPFFALQTVHVTGSDYLGEEKVLALGGIHYGTNILQLDLRRIQTSISDHPAVAEVRVARRLPSTLAVDIIEKRPVVYLTTNRGFWAVDVEGTVLYFSDSLARPLPLVTSSVPLSGINEGHTLQSPTLLAALLFVNSLTPHGKNRISELHVNDQGIVAFTSDHITINLGSGQDMVEKAEVLDALFVRISQNDLAVSSIDVRHPRTPVVEQKR